MLCQPSQLVFLPALLTTLLLAAAGRAQTQAPVVSASNFNVRVLAANLSSGNFQRYETPGLNILKGLRPDVVAIQEFNYASTNGAGISSPGAIQEMVRAVFGSNFVYFRETGYSIPNGIISRWPILSSGSWDDVQVPDRGFVWARLDLPGTNDLYVVSVHLHGNGGESSRATEAANLKTLIQSNFPVGAFIVVAGDFNTDTRTESALTTFKTFLSDAPVPTDAVAGGDPDTNQSRGKPYDYVLPSTSLATNQVPVAIGAAAFPNGLVFDSRVFLPLTSVSPVAAGDSAVSGMQHMAVVKEFRLSAPVTNFVPVPRPVVMLLTTNVLRWQGVSNLTYTVQGASDLNHWSALGAAFSSTTNFLFTNAQPSSRRFYRVTWP